MGIKITQALDTKLDGSYGAGAAQAFCDEFAQWRKAGAHVLFGKDTPYRKPLVDGADKLMHVHLMPSVNKGDHDLWMKRWRLKRPASHRTSDHVLVYVADDHGDWLLIAILDEPGAHAIADMRTPENKATMEGFAAVAEAFRANGAIIA
jgi:hypothetical protein